MIEFLLVIIIVLLYKSSKNTENEIEYYDEEDFDDLP